MRALCQWVLVRVAALALGLGVAILIPELLFRVTPGILPSRLQTLTFSKYHDLPGGMYVSEGATRMTYMRPNQEIRAFSHGYWWNHRTDSYGFRNPPELARKDVLLLGDSMIYGHGVEETQTVAHFLRSMGWGAYNMAKQGHSLYNHYILLRLYMEEIQPRMVQLFVFLNDFRELETRRPPEWIKDPPELHQLNVDEVRQRLEVLQSTEPSFLSRTLFRLHTVNLAAKWLRRPQRSSAPVALFTLQARSGSGPGRAPDAILDPARFAPLAAYYDVILQDIARRGRNQNVEVVLIHLRPHKPWRGQKWNAAQDVIGEMLNDVANRQQVPFLDTLPAFAGCGRACYLPEDGHFSEEGHRRLAVFLDQQLPRPHQTSEPGVDEGNRLR